MPESDPVKMGSSYRPLQVVSVNMDSNEVTVNTENLEEIAANLKALKVEKLSVVSVMGSYRTGKSFILDLFLRYLEYEDSAQGKDQNTDHLNVVPRESGAEYKIPAWLKDHGNLTETATNGEAEKANQTGFHWRGGAAKCTEGIWMWSKPYVKTITVTENVSKNEDEEVFVKRKIKVGLLLMDTQGAFDSQTTKQQSATIFGLTTALSSKQLYNIQNRIGSDHIEHLHYFAEMAVAACRAGALQNDYSKKSTPSSAGFDPNKNAPFQFLQMVVRDWANFDDETWDDAEARAKYNVNKPSGDRWTIEQCRAQMKLHYDQHFGTEIRERESVDVLQSMFGQISTYLFPNPGLKVVESKRRRWDGDLGEIDEDFLRFVDLFCRETFSEVTVQRVLGQDLSPDSFVKVVETLSEAFSGMEVSQLSMVEAIGKAKNLVSKDEAEKSYKKFMDRVFSSVAAKTGKDPADLSKDHSKALQIALEQYDHSATFGDLEEIAKQKKALEVAIADIYSQYQRDNERRLEQALTAFAGIATLAVFFFILDRISDYVCDWWLDTCVHASKAFVLFYTGVFGLVLFNVYRLVQERGRTAAGLAGIELGKQMVVVSQQKLDKGAYYVAHKDELIRDSKETFETAKRLVAEWTAFFLTPPADNGEKKNK